MKRGCEHKAFRARVDVNRLSNDDGGPITSFSADVQVECRDCGRAFEFCGVPVGAGGSEPRVSPDGLELRVPMMPAGERLPKGIPGVRMTFERRITTEH